MSDRDLPAVQPLKLNIGAGAVKLDGFIPIDRKFGSEAFPLKYPDDSATEIRASHILEHFSYADAKLALVEWVRVLERGATIKLAVPDFDHIVHLRAKGDSKWRFYLAGGQTDENDQHKSVWDINTLSQLMLECGLEDIHPWESDGKDCSAHKCSLNLQGRKKIADARKFDFHSSAPAETSAAIPPGKRRLKVAACLSCPRVGWNDFWGEAIAAFSAHNIPLRRFTGAFWDQCLQNMLEDMMAEGIDLAITVDYDSVFTAKDVENLILHCIQNEEIDALAALQVKRCSNFALMNLAGIRQVEVDRAEPKPIQVHSAHFGLTAIRLDALRDIPKPWLRGQPGANGSYRDDDRLDADIWFWHQWRLHGRTCFVDPTVKIGHLELMVSEFDPEMKVRHVHVHDWRETRKLEHRTEVSK